MSEPATWAALIGLGAFHGLNPSMGWLFAVARGMQQGRRTGVFQALPPLALGHAAAILATLAVLALLGLVVPPRALAAAAGVVLVGFGLWLLVAHHHPRGMGLRIGWGKLALWSFLMASGHGAGLMLAPVVLHGQVGAVDHAHEHATQLGVAVGSTELAWVAGVHTLVMLVTMTGVAAVVYEVVGLRLLRRGWINLDLVWALALLASGLTSVGLAVVG